MIVVEREEIAAEASSAAAGLLSPAGVLTGPADGANLYLAGWSIILDTIAEIVRVSGIDVECRQVGGLHVFTDENERAHLERYAEVWRTQGSEATWLADDQLQQEEPLLNAHYTTALSVPLATSIRPRLVTQAYAESARALGAHIYEHTEVTGFQWHKQSITGVETANGETIHCGRVVIATGAWSSQLTEQLGFTLPVFPSRGQILALQQPEQPLQHTIFGKGLYLVPKVDQTIYIGATREHVGFDKSNTAGGIAWLLSTAISLVPTLEQAAIAKIWTGLRPMSEDGFPILGYAPNWENIILATGHGAGGFELSALTGRTIADLITTGQLTPVIQPFGLARFNKPTTSIEEI
ncbi:glycine oxidase ThiO [Ktedonobacteria bacterium brp13]|nr:glycine oxidase ThiO [Ktedonobacteria bacterium brp13]